MRDTPYHPRCFCRFFAEMGLAIPQRGWYDSYEYGL